MEAPKIIGKQKKNEKYNLGSRGSKGIQKFFFQHGYPPSLFHSIEIISKNLPLKNQKIFQKN